MADKKLNEVTTVNSGTLANVKNFLAVMNDGSIQQMSKADLASVVGGLLYDTGDYPFQARTFSSDFNNAQDSGMYILVDVKSYKNSPGFSYGLMVVFASYYILQMCIDSFATTIKVRINIDGNWSAWKSISL